MQVTGEQDQNRAHLGCAHNSSFSSEVQVYCQEVQTWSSRFMRILPIPFHKAAHTLGSQQRGPSPSEMFLPPRLSSLLTSISCSTLLVVTSSKGCVCPPSPPALLALVQPLCLY